MTEGTAKRTESQELQYKRMLGYPNSRTFSGVAILNKRGSGMPSLAAAAFQCSFHQGWKDK